MTEKEWKDAWRERCDWCGWPLTATVSEGCVWDNCAMRPLPVLNDVGQRQQVIRKLEIGIAQAITAAVAEERDATSNLLKDEAERIGFMCHTGLTGLALVREKIKYAVAAAIRNLEF